MVIALIGGRLRLCDLGSTNGTFVDGVRITEAAVESTTALRLGRHTILELTAIEAIDPATVRFPALLGESPSMRALKTAMARIAATDATTLITGETGTGKEVIARAIHDGSDRRGRPFVIVDCGAIPGDLFEAELFGRDKGAYTGAVATVPGLFERADGGTLFLDEIGELPLDLQPKLLRAVQTRTGRRVGGTELITYDVRLIAATHRVLADQVTHGGFRADLYYRLAVACLEVPPLRERREDIPLLAARFARELGGGALALADATLDRLVAHAWPGNVRELRNLIERLMAGLPGEPELAGGAPAGDRSVAAIDPDRPFKSAKQAAIDEFERRFITELLDHHDWNIAQAARSASLDRVSIYKILTRLGIHRRPAAE